MVRASALHAEGQRFEPSTAHHEIDSIIALCNVIDSSLFNNGNGMVTEHLYFNSDELDATGDGHGYDGENDRKLAGQKETSESR